MNNRLVNRFCKYVEIDSESRNERQFADLLKSDLRKLGLEVREDLANLASEGNSGNIIAYLKGNCKYEPILLSAHMDTVKPGIGIVPVENEGIISSKGDTILGSDDKAGVAGIIEGLTRVIENGDEHGDVEIVFSICEEVGLIGVKNLDFSTIKSEKAYIFDSSGDIGGIVTVAPALTKIKAKAIGKPAHAGIEPEKGISAISILADAISNMTLFRIDEETTANVGTISGGTATNIVAEHAETLIEVRSLSMDKLKDNTDRIIRHLNDSAAKFGGNVEIEVSYLYPSFRHDDDDEIVTSAKKALEKMNIDGYTRSSGGGSDANIYNANGLKAVNLNIGSRKVHTLDEHITVDSLEKVSELVRLLIICD